MITSPRPTIHFTKTLACQQKYLIMKNY